VAYASSSDLVARFDATIIGDLASDTGEAVPVDQLGNSSAVTVALDDSSGQVDAALVVGKQYVTTDLEGLEGTALALLKRIVCQLAMVYLMERRQENMGSDRLKSMKEAVEEYLDKLRSGDRIFGIDANLDASLPNLDGPSTLNHLNMNLLPSRVHNYYPNVAQRLPLTRK
jgi:phage gp36-like protein